MKIARLVQIAAIGTTVLVSAASQAATQCDGEKDGEGKKKSFTETSMSVDHNTATTQCDGEKDGEGKKKS
jgi:hypothetical protein